MSEVVRHIPENVATARPKEEQAALKYPDAKAAYWNRGRKARRQTWADLEAIAESRQQTEEAVQQYWEKQAAQTQETGKYRGGCFYWLSLVRFSVQGTIIKKYLNNEPSEDLLDEHLEEINNPIASFSTDSQLLTLERSPVSGVEGDLNRTF